MNNLLTTLLAVTTAHAWHTQTHHVMGYMLELLNPQGNHLRQMVDYALIAGSADINGGCDFNNYATASAFPDDMMNSTHQMKDWHINDIKSHLSYYLDEHDNVMLAESTDTGEIIPAAQRSIGWAACDDGRKECYGQDAVAGLRQNGECNIFLKDFQDRFLEDGTGQGAQGGFATVAYERGFLIRHAIHLIGDAHQPLHNGSLFSKIGLDENCCPPGSPMNAGTRRCQNGGISLSDPKDSICSGLDNPRLYCRQLGDYDSLEGAEGDRGAFDFYLQLNDGMWGRFREPGSGTHLHWVWDEAFGLFETTRNDVSGEPWLICNEDVEGNLKFFNVTEYSQNGDTLISDTNAYWLNQKASLASYVTPEFAESLRCHAEKLIEDYPRDKIRTMMQADIVAALENYYGADAPDVPPAFFKPETTDLNTWQDEVNWFRHWLIYKPFLDLPTKLKGADCPSTGIAAYPSKWWEHSRKLSRAWVALGGYRIDSFLTEIAANFVPSPLQMKQGDYNTVCQKLDPTPSSSLNTYAPFVTIAASTIPLFF